MSEPVSALGGARYEGRVTVEDAGPMGMVTLRADLSSDAVRNAIRGAGLPLPGKGEATGGQGESVLWMSPDELMLLCGRGEAEARCAALAKALGEAHGLVVDVSDARAVVRLSGSDAAVREVLAKLTPADLRPGSLGVGRVRRSRLAQVPAAFWFTAEGEALVISFRSVAEYVFGLLSNAARPGAEVGFF